MQIGVKVDPLFGNKIGHRPVRVLFRYNKRYEDQSVLFIGHPSPLHIHVIKCSLLGVVNKYTLPFRLSLTVFVWKKHIQGGPKKNNTESMSNIHNKLNTCISSKCKSL